MANLVDLSVTLQENIASDPPGLTPAIDYFTHLETAKDLVSYFPGMAIQDLHKGCGMGREATLFLTSRGVRVTGTDARSWDAPFVHAAKKYAETGDTSLIWEGHKAGMEIGYCHIEKLHNLEALPATGLQISCFPVKIDGASAGWTRAVAILDETSDEREQA